MKAATPVSEVLPILEVDAISAGYGGAPVLANASLRITPGDIVALCGPNGSGKSTLLRVMSRLLRPEQGRVLLHDQALNAISRRALARKMAFMPQSPTSPPGVTVREMIGYGRSPHTSWLRAMSRGDQDQIDEALRLCDLGSLEQRLVSTLSGGERQRAWLAMAVAQEPEVLLLDEPVSALDVGHQLDVLSLLDQLNERRGTTIVIVLHDINLAARFCRSLVAIHERHIVAAGSMHDTLTSDLLQRVFGVHARVHHLPSLSYPLCTFDRPTIQKRHRDQGP